MARSRAVSPSRTSRYALRVVGRIRSPLLSRADCPKQGREGAPDAWLEVDERFAPALEGIEAGDEVLLFTWLHHGRRDRLRVHPRGDPRQPLLGVFATRSPDRPNPIGLHRVKILEVRAPARVKVGPLEALDGTPVVDVKPVLSRSGES